MMSGIRGKNTKPELLLRRALHAAGYRYRLHSSRVPGKPDMLFGSRQAAVFVNGCFWHGHDCRFFKMPGTRTGFWSAKIEANRQRDAKVAGMLRERGWRRLVVWECALRAVSAEEVTRVAQQVGAWLDSPASEGEIRGA
jgi:DNA mismatch endonuclease (patch repair protein)